MRPAKNTDYNNYNYNIETQKQYQYPTYAYISIMFGSILLFVVSILLISNSIKSFGFDPSSFINNSESIPYIGLFIGLLSTALLQSSSTTTTITIAAVSSGTLTLESAIPIILGANVGTTITSTIVSMGYVTKTNEFKNAIAAGTIHDIFNMLMVLILFPLELKYHILENLSLYISSLINVKAIGAPAIGWMFHFNSMSEWLINKIGSIPTLIISIILLFTCIKYISKLIYDHLIGSTKELFETTVFSNTRRSFGWGLLITSIAQSSSLTTSLIVPLVATKKIKITRAFQFILGANLGTTITALLAATFQSEAATQLAIAHLLFNLIGIVLFLFIPFLKKLPIILATRLGLFTVRLRIIGFAYIFFTFFVIPFTLIYLSKGIIEPEKVEINSED